MSSNRKPARPKRPAPDAEGIRLQKVLAAAGIASRRRAEMLIDEGRVTVDGAIVREQGMRVDPRRARIEVDGERISVHPDHEYVLLNKPAGVLTTASDPQGRKTVFQFVRTKRRLFSVGRLDAETTGLLLLTTDGELAQRLAHPRYEVPRTYLAEVRGAVEPRALRRLLEGVPLEDGVARATRAKIVRASRGKTHLELTLTEGRKHEVRRMLEGISHPVISLARIRFGPLKLRDLPLGATRRLTPAEVGEMLAAVGL